MKRFLIAVRNLMEHKDASYSLLASVKQGEDAQGDVDRAPGRQLEHQDFFLRPGCRLAIDEEAHEPELECGGSLGLVPRGIAMKELLIVSPSTQSFRRHFKELEGCCVGP